MEAQDRPVNIQVIRNRQQFTAQIAPLVIKNDDEFHSHDFGLTETPPCVADPIRFLGFQLPCLPPDWPFSFLKQEPSRVTRFTVWEVFAIIQSLFFAFIILCELWGGKLNHRVVLLLLIAVIEAFAGLSLFYLSLRQQTEFLAGGSLLFIIEDISIFLYFRHGAISSTEEPQKRYDAIRKAYAMRVLWGVDVPLFLGTVTMAIIVWNTSQYDVAEAHVFFAGGTAFSLILSNVAIAFLRVFLHVEHKNSLKCKWPHYLFQFWTPLEGARTSN